MRKRLQEIAFDAGERFHRVLDENPRPLSLKSLKEGLLPLSDMDLIGINKLVNGTTYNGGRMERVSNGSVMAAGIGLGIKYIFGYGIAGSMLYVSLKEIIN